MKCPKCKNGQMRPARVPRGFRCETPGCSREMAITVMGQRLCEHH